MLLGWYIILPELDPESEDGKFGSPVGVTVIVDRISGKKQNSAFSQWSGINLCTDNRSWMIGSDREKTLFATFQSHSGGDFLHYRQYCSFSAVT